MKKATEPCIFCGNLPCTCNDSPPKKRKPKPASTPSTSAPSSTKQSNRFSTVARTAERTDLNSAGKTLPVAVAQSRPSSSFPVISQPKSRFTVDASDEESKSPDELEFEAAMLNLEDVLDSSVKRQYPHIFNRPVPIKIQRDLKEWRERNGLGQ